MSADYSDVDFLFIVSLDDWEAMAFEWVSPIAQFVEHNRCKSMVQQGLVARPTTKPDSLLCTAARCAFWGMSLTSLRQLSKHMWGADADIHSSLCKTLAALISDVLGLRAEDPQLVSILRMRLSETTCNYEHFVELEGAMEVLPDEDKKLAKEMLDKEKTKDEDFCLALRGVGELRTRFQAVWYLLMGPGGPPFTPQDLKQFRKELVHREKAVAKKSTAGRSSGSHGAAPQRKTAKQTWKGLARMTPDNPTQPEANRLKPPGSYIWRGNFGAGSWQIHPTGHPRRSIPWTVAGGGKAACLQVLQYAWRAWLTDQGLEEKDCPISGIFHPSLGQPASST